MGTISKLTDWLSRGTNAAEPAIRVTAYGFALGDSFVAWETVSEIWSYKVDLITTDEVFLEFSTCGRVVEVSEECPGFAALETAMTSAFPVTSDWRAAVLAPAFARNRTILYRRA